MTSQRVERTWIRTGGYGRFRGEWVKLSKREISRLYSIVHVAMETTKMSNFTCQSKSFISIFFTWQVSACELQPFSCHDLANDIYSQTAKTVFSHLKQVEFGENVRVFFPQGQSKVSVIMRCLLSGCP